jgi:hypothetical protein
MVAKLPFTPFPFMRPLSHRNLPGEDFRDCSMVRPHEHMSVKIRVICYAWEVTS